MSKHTNDIQPITLPVYVISHYNVNEKKHCYQVSDYKLDAENYMTVHKTEITFDPPDRSTLDAKTIAALRAKATEIKAEAQKKVVEIEEAIQSLLAIEAPVDYDNTVIKAREYTPYNSDDEIPF